MKNIYSDPGIPSPADVRIIKYQVVLNLSRKIPQFPAIPISAHRMEWIPANRDFKAGY
jgi:hypothetical protein